MSGSGRPSEFLRVIPPEENARDWPKMPSGWLVELRPRTVIGPYQTREIALVVAARMSSPGPDGGPLTR